MDSIFVNFFLGKLLLFRAATISERLLAQHVSVQEF